MLAVLMLEVDVEATSRMQGDEEARDGRRVYVVRNLRKGREGQGWEWAQRPAGILGN